MMVLDDYIENIKTEINDKNIKDELTIIKFVYFDLGKRYSFDPQFFPFGNSKYRINLYRYHSHRLEDLNDCFKNKIAICKSIAYTLEYVCKNLGIDIETLIDESTEDPYGVKDTSVKYPHVYNRVTLKYGRSFMLDLQDDVRNIQAKFFTRSFGTKTLHGDEYVIDKQEQEKIDRLLGYISDENYYTDDYLYLLHYYADGITDINEKIDFILENIDYALIDKMGFIDRQWLHKTILEEFFDKSEFNYDSDTGVILFINSYKDDKASGEYISFIQVYNKGKVTIYMYNEENYKYEKISIEEVANLCMEGYVLHKSKIIGLERTIKKIKSSNV